GHHKKSIAYSVKVVERLAHTHQHDVGNATFTTWHYAIGRSCAAGPIAEPVACSHHLADDLSRGQIPDPALGAGVAESTIERAADLAGDAQGSTFGIWDVDAFDLMRAFALHFAGKPQQPFARAVDRNLLGNDFWAGQGKTLSQQRTQAFRHAGH